MIETISEPMSKGMNLYYRGYLIHEDIRSIYYTIYGTRPDRRELASAATSRGAMQWVDSRITEPELPSLMVWPSPSNMIPTWGKAGI